MFKFGQVMEYGSRGGDCKGREGNVKGFLKLEQIGFRICIMATIILCSSNSSHAASHQFSREDAFIGYSEHNLERRHQNLGLQVIPDEHLILKTRYGEIKVKLAIGEAPHAVKYIKGLINQGLTKGCSFYRVEPIGPTVDEGHEGIREGYALVQGGLYSCGRQESNQLPLETRLNNTRGSVSLITGTSEFFFSLKAHPEWDGNFSVWGKVMGLESWETLKRIAGLSTRQETHSSGTVLRMLVNVVTFEARLEPSRTDRSSELTLNPHSL